MDDKQYLELPVEGLNIVAARKGMVPHYAVEEVENTWEIDEEAWRTFNDQIAQHNRQVWEDSITKLPVEIYRQYKAKVGLERFREFKAGCGNLLVQDEVTGSIFYANDLAQVVVALRRPVSYEVLNRAIIDINRDYLLTWGRQLGVFKRDLPEPNAEHIARLQYNSQVVERYDKNMQLMYVYPSVLQAAAAIGTQSHNIDDAATRHRPINGEWFRYYYDNDFCATTHKFVQLRNGQEVNRFKSVKEASKLLGIPVYTIYRLVREDNLIDRFGCKWTKDK